MKVMRMKLSQQLITCAITITLLVILYQTINSLFSRVIPAELPVSHHGRHGNKLPTLEFSVDSLHVVESEKKPSMSDLSPAWSFRPSFVYVNKSRPHLHTDDTKEVTRIPRIFHQVWDTTIVPVMYAKWMRSWKARHATGGWQHWFWTLQDVRSLIARHYPNYLTLYDSYESPVFRADVMRYFVLHRYGGVYVDLDMEAVRPMDDWTTLYSFLVTEECYEHTFVIREEKVTNIMNGFIASAPGHPFMDIVIRSLDEAAMKYFGDYLYATGPQFFNSVFRRYEAKQVGHTTKNSSLVTVLPPYYFLPTYDPSESDVISGKCMPPGLRKLPPKAQIVCRELARRSFHNTVDPLAYTDHHWIHAYMYDNNWKVSNAQSVFDLVPGIQAAAKATNEFQ